MAGTSAAPVSSTCTCCALLGGAAKQRAWGAVQRMQNAVLPGILCCCAHIVVFCPVSAGNACTALEGKAAAWQTSKAAALADSPRIPKNHKRFSQHTIQTALKRLNAPMQAHTRAPLDADPGWKAERRKWMGALVGEGLLLTQLASMSVGR